MEKAKVVYMGTPDFSVPILEMLIKNTDVVLVVTQPDKEVGRKKEVRKSPVKIVAENNNIPVFQPIKIRKDYEELKKYNPDLIVTCAYGQIVPQEVLDLPKHGAINVHASLLPKYRGAAPIQWAILNGEKETGVTLMYMDAGMDTGDMIIKKSIPIEESDNVGTLHDKLSQIGASLLEENLESILNETASREKQKDEEATMAPMIKRMDEHLDFNLTGKEIINKIKAFNPWPLANIIIDGQEIKVIEAEFLPKKDTISQTISIVNKNTLGIDALDGVIYLKKIKPFGKKEMNIESFLNGINKEKLIKKRIS